MLKEEVVKTIQKYQLLKNGDTIVVGVSGGPDSTCLLHILVELQKEYSFQLHVAHINHGIRKEAGEDEEYVKNLCKNFKIPFNNKKEKVEEIAKKNKWSIEEAGREIRYAFFKEIANKTGANKIATAHTANDNAETVLMNLLRGSGTNGLKGIEPIRDGVYIRPLIEISRNQIEEYCKMYNLHPKMDSTNQENMYTRNKVRNQLIPYLEEQFNPNIISTLNRLSNIAKEENSYFEKITKKAYEEIKISQTKEKIELDLKVFNTFDLVIKNRILLYTIKELLGTSNGIGRIHLQDIISLCQNNIGNKYLIPNKKIKILVQSKKICFLPNQ